MGDYLREQFGLDGKRALVTGASRGIGRAIAVALAGAGADVVVHYHRGKAEAEQTAAMVKEHGGKAWCVAADLTQARDADLLVEAAAEHLGGLDVLINNAGALVQRRAIADAPDDLIDQVIRVNIHSTIYTCRAAIRLLQEGNEPSIVNLTSIAAHNGGGNNATLYASSKGMILTYTRGLAKELAPTVRVNGIAPGVIDTDFHKKVTSGEAMARFGEMTPLRRLGLAEDCAPAAVYLCSKAASFVTGEVMEINGGLWVV